MSTEDNEYALTGGVSADVTRIGDTVRRTPSAAAPTIYALLRHLGDNGFTRLPRPLGTDAQGREIFAYIEGRAGHPPITDDLASDEALISAATTIREFHDASTTFTGHGWNPDSADPTGEAEVICHNDLAPFNLVYQGRQVAAIIDWDGAAPGRRVWDLAYAVWRLVPLHRPEYALPLGWPDLDRGRRLALFADAYGMAAHDRAALLSTVRERQLLNTEGMRKLARQGRLEQLDPSDPRAESGDLPYLDRNAGEWHVALTRN